MHGCVTFAEGREDVDEDVEEMDDEDGENNGISFASRTLYL